MVKYASFGLGASPIVATQTGADGAFSLTNVPSGTDIPLVMQVGRWRRLVKIPKVRPCEITTLTDKMVTRLPRMQSEGDLPRIALVSGQCDPFECILRQIGIDDSEFTAPSGTGRVHIYQGAPGTLMSGAHVNGSTAIATDLWSSAAVTGKYDMQLDACECAEGQGDKPQASLDTMVQYVNGGGRLLLGHSQYYWIDPQLITPTATGPWLGTATFHTETSTTMSTAFATIDMTAPKGVAYASWLLNTGASSTRGTLPLSDVRYNVTDVGATGFRWTSASGGLMQYSFNAPVGVPPAQQCGKVAYYDYHAMPASSSAGMTFPQECVSVPGTPQLKAFEFMLFDLASCIQNDAAALVPPN